MGKKIQYKMGRVLRTETYIGRVFGHQKKMKNFLGILLSTVMVMDMELSSLSKKVHQHSIVYTTPFSIKIKGRKL